VRELEWPRNDIDRFILHRLEGEGLRPSMEADRRTLIRRVTFDLTGLPPPPEQVERFLSDPDPFAYEALVDRLLASPHYGERWARHWLDVVHFGESHGYDKDKPRLNAWPYRDYVIQSLNADKPYFRFVEEQLAGDVLYPEDPDGVVALGFIAAGPWDFVGHVELPESKTDGLIARYNDRDDMVMTTMSTFMSLTVHCARCHDHKFDPIPQRDYYALQAVFAGVDRADRPFDRDPKIHRERHGLLGEKDRLARRKADLDAIVAGIESSPEMESLDGLLEDRRRALSALGGKKDEKPGDGHQSELAERRELLEEEIERLRHLRLEQALARLEPDLRDEFRAVFAQLKSIEESLSRLPKPEWVYAAASRFAPQGSFRPAEGPRPIHLLRRGDVRAKGELVEAGTLSCFSWMPAGLEIADPSDEGQRRAGLARWLTDSRNGLLRRSIVNRIWHYHFGRGLVETPNDFGWMGAAPSHPELLDWLAQWFQRNGESFKALHRLIVTSATYRQSSQGNEPGLSRDADNRLLSRMNRARLDGESLRDSLLAVSGRLDRACGGPSAQQFWFKDDHSPTYDYTRFDVDSSAGARRSVYRFIVRSVSDPFMDIMDCPDSSLLTPKRNETLTALQALALLNNPFVLRQAEHLAERLHAECGGTGDVRAQVDRAYKLVLGREPSARELERLSEYAARHGMANACRVLFNSNEFLFID
jgi:hypothetical protein